MICKVCGKEINDNATFCPYCGAEIEAKAEKSEEVVQVRKEKEEINQIGPIIGFAIALGLYVAGFLLLKFERYVRSFGDYLVFLLLIPLGVLGMILTGLGRRYKTTRAVKIMSWASFGLFIFDFLMLFASFILFVD